MKKAMKRPPGGVWTWPLALALASTAGLLFALVGDGVWDVMSWLALAAPVVVIAACLYRRGEEAAPERR